MKTSNNVYLIARNEFISSVRNRALPLFGVLLAALLVAAGLIGWRNYETLNDQRARYQQVVREQWTGQPDRHPHRVAHYGYLAFRPKAPLSFFDFGIDSYAGTTIFLEAHRQNTVNFSEARHSSGMLRFGELSMATALQLLVPLVIFFLGFAAVTQERENGTLPLLLCQGVSWQWLLLGKIVGLLSVVALLLIPMTLLCACALWLTADFTVSGDLAARLLLLAAGYGIYFAVCVALAVMISALHRTSRGSLMTLVGMWILLWVVVPRALPAAGAALYPTPSKAEFDARLEEEVRQHGDSHNPNDPHFAALRQQYLIQYGARDVKELPVNFGGVVMREAEKVSTEVFKERYEQLLDIFNKQNRLTEWAGLLNPYLAIRGFSAALSGSDFAHYTDFQWQAETHRYDFVQQLNELHAHEIKFADDRTQRVSHERWAEFPPFNYCVPGVRWALRSQLIAVVALPCWLLLVVAFGGWVTRRVRVKS